MSCRAYVPPAGDQVVSPQAAFIVTDILAGNTVQGGQPVLGQVPDPRPDRRLPPGHAQDRHEQRRQGPQRLRLHRAADRAGSGRGGLRARGRGVERQLRQQPVSTPARPALLHRCLHVRLAGLPVRGQREVAGDQFQGTRQRPGAGQDRSVHRAFPGPRPSAVDEWFITGHGPHEAAVRRPVRRSTSSPRSVSRTRYDSWMKASRDWLRRAQRGPGVAGGPDRTRTSYFYNNAFNPVRPHLGRARGRRGLRPAEPIPTCFVVPTPDASGVIAVVRDPVAIGSGVAALPCPTASGPVSPTPSVEVSPTPTGRRHPPRHHRRRPRPRRRRRHRPRRPSRPRRPRRPRRRPNRRLRRRPRRLRPPRDIGRRA